MIAIEVTIVCMSVCVSYGNNTFCSVMMDIWCYYSKYYNTMSDSGNDEFYPIHWSIDLNDYCGSCCTCCMMMESVSIGSSDLCPCESIRKQYSDANYYE